MAGIETRKGINSGFGRQALWLGRSGRAYQLATETLDAFVMADADLYVIAKGSHVLWVGSTGDLVGDPMSRSRFRLALDCGTQVLRLRDGNDAERYSTMFDLEGAEPAQEAVAA